MQTTRELERVVRGRETSDGAGVRLLRVLTQDLQKRLDPFLMLDEFRSDDPDDYIAGFPDHPHRGFETVTYMLNGNIEHRDNHGGHGLLGAGGVQWMTAGRGIVHSELPRQENGLMHGFQLWLNLPAKDKMCAPGYRDISAAEIPNIVGDGGARIKVIAGRVGETQGAMLRPDTDPLYLDVELEAGAAFTQSLPEDYHAFVYVYEGELTVGSDARHVSARQMGVLAQTSGSDHVQLQAGAAGAKLLLIAGKPLREPIVQWGPFVMNTSAEIEATLQDFRDGRF